MAISSSAARAAYHSSNAQGPNMVSGQLICCRCQRSVWSYSSPVTVCRARQLLASGRSHTAITCLTTVFQDSALVRQAMKVVGMVQRSGNLWLLLG